MIRFNVPDMSCGHCKASIERAVASIDPSAGVTIDLSSRTVDIESAASPQAFAEAIKSEGYETTRAD